MTNDHQETAIRCIICNRPTESVCGDWCEEYAGQPMCIPCENEHGEDVAFDKWARGNGSDEYATVRERLANDNGNRTPLSEVAAELGVDLVALDIDSEVPREWAYPEKDAWHSFSRSFPDLSADIESLYVRNMFTIDAGTDPIFRSGWQIEAKFLRLAELLGLTTHDWP